MNNRRLVRNRKWLGFLLTVAALGLIVVVGFAVNRWRVNNSVISKVIIDANPSIQLNVNSKDKVLSGQALNDDGEKVIGDMNLKNIDLDVVLNALLGSMLQNGYLSDMQNAILVSVENDDVERATQLQAKLTKAIEQILNNKHFESVVFGQAVRENQNIKELSSQYNISKGKAELINDLIKQDNRLNFEELAQLSVHEIALIMESKGIEASEVTKIGNTSKKAYISKEQAKAIAYTHAKVDGSMVRSEEIEFDTDDGIILYEIEFMVGTTEYDYEIHAITGEVIKYNKEVKTDSINKDNSTIGKTSFIGKEKAKAAALTHSKVGEHQITKIEIDFDNEFNNAVYEIEFETDDVEYEYLIDAITGEVLEYERNESNNSGSDKEANSNSNMGKEYIGKDKAKSIALNHAGVDEVDLKEYEVELDKDDNRVKYEIEFETSKTEYEYEIDAYTGEVLKSESEDRDRPAYNKNQPIATESPMNYISEDKIKEIVFQHAGVDAAKVKDLEIELDGSYDNDDIAIYEINFELGKLEYEYEVNAITGSIIKSKVEADE